MLTINFRVEIDEAVRVLRAEGVVALPTDTLYGLGADVFSERALRRVFEIKGRPAQNAMPVLVADWEQVRQVAADVGEVAAVLARSFWPGALSLVVRRLPGLSDLVTGGRDTVALRMPDHSVPLHLARELSRPISGTSANLSGEPDLLTLGSLEDELGDLVDYIVRCGPEPRGVPSTLVDVTSGAPRLLRQGALPFDQILEACR